MSSAGTYIDATGSALANPLLPILQCPSDPAVGNNAALSYVVNRGRNGVDNNPAVGVCFNQWAGGVPVSLDYISAHDGSTTTLLLSESLISHPPGYYIIGRDAATALAPVPNARPYYFRTYPYWNSPSLAYYDNTSLISPTPGDLLTSSSDVMAALCEVDLGFEWGSLQYDYTATGTPTVTGNTNHIGIGAKLGNQIESRHAGIIISAFCDGHVSPLKEGMDLDTFKQLMTPWGLGYTTFDASGNPTNDGPVAVLDEANF
jgi:hypothetical protein